MNTELNESTLSYAILLILKNRSNITLEEILERIEIMIQRGGFCCEDYYEKIRYLVEQLTSRRLIRKDSEIVIAEGRAFNRETFNLTEIGVAEIDREGRQFLHLEDQVLLALTEEGHQHLQGILLLMIAERPGVREVALLELVSRIIASGSSSLLDFPENTPQDSDDTVQAVLKELLNQKWIRREIDPQSEDARYFTTSEGGAIAPSFRLPGSGEV